MTGDVDHATKGGDGPFDLLVIGTGAAGMAAALRGAELGQRVAIIEDGTVGGTCVNVGCIPSKYLLAEAAAHQAARMGSPGVAAAAPRPDWPEILSGKREVVESLRNAKYLGVLETYPEITLLRGRARLTVAGTVALDGRTYRGRKVVLATGTEPWLPPIPGLDDVDALTSTTAMELETLPGSMVVLGGGSVGLELGQVFARLGVRVTVLEALPRILPGEDPEASAELERQLRVEGIEIVTGAGATGVERRGEHVAVHARTAAGERVVVAEHLLVAAGRRARTEGLGLHDAGVATDERGFIRVDDELRTSHPDVYAAGDVTGLPGFVYVAASAGRVAAENAVGAGGVKLDLRALPRVTFTSPQVASVGLTPAEARGEGREVEVGRLRLEHVPRAVVEGRTRGWIRVVAERGSGRLLGVQAVGPNAAELLGEATLAVRLGLTTRDVLDTLHPYLTWVEGFKLAVQAVHVDVSRLSCCA